MKRNIFASLLTLPLLFSLPIAYLSSCSNNSSVDQSSISGGSVNLSSDSSGVDNFSWKYFFNNTNVSKDVFWSIEPQINGISTKYNALENGVNIVWNNLVTGQYIFKLKGIYQSSTQGKSFNASSPEIRILIHGTLTLLGGTTEINGQKSGSYSENPWKIIYLDKDYSAIAEWSLTIKEEFTSKILVKYSDEAKGAILEWNDLVSGTYLFTIKCVFQIESGKSLFATSNVISVYITEQDELFLTGGKQFTTTPYNQFGRIERPLVVALKTTGEDVTLQCDLKIINCLSSELVYIGKDIRNAYIYWLPSKEPILISFDVQVTYKENTVIYPFKFWLNFVEI